MRNTSTVIVTYRSNVFSAISWLFGIAVFATGLINTFWGNDPFFGVFLVALSFVYFPPANAIFYNRFNLSFPVAVKILLGICIIFGALGVGELFDKIDLMLRDV